MRSVKAALVALVFLLAASEASAQVWGNQPAGSTVLTDCAFPLSNCAGWYDGYGTPYATDLSDPVSPPTVADFFLRYVGDCSGPVPYAKPCANGGGQFGYLSSTQGAELYVGVMLKLNAEYGCSSVGTSKTVFLRAFDQTYGGPRTNGVWTFNGCGATKQFIFSHNTGDQAGYPALHNEHACPQDPFNGLLCYPNVGTGTFQRGTWVKFEACVKASTNMTSRDAIVKWWVDGVLAGHYTNLNYGQGLMNQFDATPTWDGYGNGQGFTADAHQYYGHVRVARVPNGGCASGTGGGGSPPPPTPTPTPTPPPPPPSASPGTVGDLSATAVNTTRASVQFTAVSDGTGNPAKYDIRIMRDVMNWGAAQSVSVGTCTVSFAPGVMAQITSCNIDGLTAGYTYKVQLVAFRGTLNLNAVYGNLSNVASVTMLAETPPPTPPPPTPPPTPPSQPPGISAPTSLSLRAADTYRIVNGSDIWELRGTATPYVLYRNGVCGLCNVVGYSLVFSTDLNAVGVEFVPGKYQYLDSELNEWVVISGPIVGVTGASVTGSFLYSGTIPAGFNVYWSATAGGSKAKLPLYKGVWDRGFYDVQHSYGCYIVKGYDGTGLEGPASTETCTASDPGSSRDIGQITPRKVIDFAGAVWELQGAYAPYVMYKDGVCECTLAGYSLRYKTGVVEMEYLPGKWVRRDATLNEWVITEP